MKSKDLSDIRKKSIKQLDTMLTKSREELDQVKIDMSLGKESDFKKAKKIKKEIAQILTIIKEKEIVEKSQDNNAKQDKKRSSAATKRAKSKTSRRKGKNK